jgi:hypothetical protein
MPTPTKLQNPTIVSSGDQDSGQWSHTEHYLPLLNPHWFGYVIWSELALAHFQKNWLLSL